MDFDFIEELTGEEVNTLFNNSNNDVNIASWCCCNSASRIYGSCWSSNFSCGTGCAYPDYYSGPGSYTYCAASTTYGCGSSWAGYYYGT